jgi:hypothetical protein
VYYRDNVGMTACSQDLHFTGNSLLLRFVGLKVVEHLDRDRMQPSEQALQYLSYKLIFVSFQTKSLNKFKSYYKK